jgi:hypothetical protein
MLILIERPHRSMEGVSEMHIYMNLRHQLTDSASLAMAIGGEKAEVGMLVHIDWVQCMAEALAEALADRPDGVGCL